MSWLVFKAFGCTPFLKGFGVFFASERPQKNTPKSTFKFAGARVFGL